MDIGTSRYYEIKEQLLFVSEARPETYTARKIIPIPERLIRCIWFDQRLNGKKLHTLDGLPVKVFSQGEWNMCGGPDFLEALVQIGDADPIKAPVEIHVRSSDWRRHGHQNNSEFRDVALNISMWHDDASPVVYNDLNEPIAQVELCGAIDEDIMDVAADIDMENYPFASHSRVGRCHKAMQGRGANTGFVLELAGQERLLAKARRFCRELQRRAFAEVLYRAVMESMGYRPNKQAFRRLAACAPLEAVQRVEQREPPERRALALQALFFGASGLFSNVPVNMFDSETAEYCEALAAHWAEYEKDLCKPFLHKKDWTLRGVRPANFPLRRMAAAAHLWARFGARGLERRIADLGREIKAERDPKAQRKILSALVDDLHQPAEGYWKRRMSPGGAVLESVPSLIGKSHAMSVVVNVVLPLLVCRAQKQGDADLREAALNFFGSVPRLDQHQITRIMRYRVFGDIHGGQTLLRREIIQQGLLQVFFDFCDENVRDCARCKFPDLIRMGPDLRLEME
jgi:hypothetical protein